MGNLFLEYIEKNPLSCKYCNTHITSKDALINDIPIETMYNEAKNFGLIVNRLLIPNPNWCSYTTHNTFDMFDDNSICENNISSFYLHCKNCLSFIGWKYDNMYILLNKAIV